MYSERARTLFRHVDSTSIRRIWSSHFGTCDAPSQATPVIARSILADFAIATIFGSADVDPFLLQPRFTRSRQLTKPSHYPFKVSNLLRFIPDTETHKQAELVAGCHINQPPIRYHTSPRSVALVKTSVRSFIVVQRHL